MILDKIFTSSAVFPAGKPVKVYGEGNGSISVKLAGIEAIAVAENGRWLTEFPPMEYGGPYELTVSNDDDTIILNNIYIGEVYLIAGQSNAAFKLCESNYGEENYISNKLLRMYSTKNVTEPGYFTPEDGWVECKKEDAGQWTALGYMIGNRISMKKDIAVGIIGCFQGASVIESWLPKNSIKEHLGISLDIKDKHSDHTYADYSAWNGDGVLYETKIKDIIPYSLTGVMWYQGESDTSVAEARIYSDELSLLIDIWRNDFKDAQLPFVVVQIADYIHTSYKDGWKMIQAAQKSVADAKFGVTAVTSADVCENTDIHPPTKDKLAERIADEFMKL